MIQLRDYQALGIERISAQYRDGRKRVILVSPTGSGKSRMAAAVVERTVARSKRVLILAPRIEILGQLVREVGAAGIAVRSIHAEHDEGPADAPVVVASVWTLALPRWRDQLPPADLIVIDEVHRAIAESYVQLVACYPGAYILGLTATPSRSDGRGLGEAFDAIVSTTTTKELREQGFLVPCRILVPAGAGAGLALDPVEAYRERCDGRLAIVFAAGVKHARTVTDAFIAAGIAAGLVTGTTPDEERAETMRRFAAGDLRALVNVNCFVEGLDVPACAAAIFCKKFGHIGPYLQAIGRILRPAPDKADGIVVDLAGSALQHGHPEDPREYSLEGAGIRSGNKAKRDRVRQCESCGSVCPSGEPACPFCGAVFAGAPLPEVSGVGVKEFTGRAKDDRPVQINTRWAGRCMTCRGPIRPGDRIWWFATARKTAHMGCTTTTMGATA